MNASSRNAASSAFIRFGLSRHSRIELASTRRRAMFVYEAYTDPELMSQWLGPRRLTMTVQEMDVRTGGRSRYTHESEDGDPFVFFGEFREGYEKLDELLARRRSQPRA